MTIIVDADLGNIRSVFDALQYVGSEPVRATSPDALCDAERVILPGVGSFAQGMANLRSRGWIDPLREHVQSGEKPLLGICLGMQLLSTVGFESRRTQGLNFFDATVEKFDVESSCGTELKVPHVGFNSVDIKYDSHLFSGLGNQSDFYFTHSFRLKCNDESLIVATCDYGGTFPAAVQKGNIFGVQFHPEKSQTNGLKVLKNFSEI